MPKLVGLPRKNYGRPMPSPKPDAPAVKGTPQSCFVGDVDLKKVPVSLFRIKAPRKMRVVNPTIKCGQVFYEETNAFLVEVFRNGMTAGTVRVENGSISFPSFVMEQFDEIELCAIENQNGASLLKSVWILYCVE